MTQNYARMPMQQQQQPYGMPIIPPRHQQAQQQQLLQQNRQMQQRQPLQSMQSMPNIPVRSVSNGGTRARPAYGNSNTANYISSSSRLRSESNPASSGYGNDGGAPAVPSGGGQQGHLRANSSGSNGSGYSGRTLHSNNSTSSSSTLMSFQDRMKERDRDRQQRERGEREAAARAIQEDPVVNQLVHQAHNATAAAAAAQPSTGASLWNKLRAAKDVINTVITGEERWPDSDDSDCEGESHVSRVLRDYFDKKDEQEMVKKIAELEMTPVTSPLTKASTTGTGGYTRNRLARDGSRREDPLSKNTYSPPSQRGRGGESGHQPSRSEDNTFGRRLVTGAEGVASNIGRSGSNGSLSVKVGNRMRTSSDASRDEALGRLEGKRSQDALVAQISHLGSTRARSPHRGQHAYKDNIDTEPPPPLPTPKSTFRQRQPLMPSASSPALLKSSNSNKDLGAYGQRRLQKLQEQATQQQQQTANVGYF